MHKTPRKLRLEYKEFTSLPFEFQVAILTERIKNLTSHFEKNKKDHSGMRGLMKMIGQRRSLLKYLSNKDEARYNKLIKELDLRK